MKEIEDFYKFEPKIYNKIEKLLESIIKNPFEGIGKPEKLKHNWNGYWSRRIRKEHRLVYRVKNDKVIIVQCRFHYEK